MPKKIPAHLASKARKCIFCQEPGTSKTHIWPDWLERLLSPPSQRLEELERPIPLSPTNAKIDKSAKLRQGSLFTQKPYLCCEACNTGWMHDFEDEMNRFAKPLFTSLDVITLSQTERRILSVWVSLIVVLAEHIDRSQGSICISQDEKTFIRTRLMPPDTWSIVACSLNSEAWAAKYRHHSLFIGDFRSRAEYDAAVMEGRQNNTQISSLGMGNLFVQAFSCPNPRISADFRATAKSRGLVQLWPSPLAVLAIAERPAKFPTQLILKDESAESAANAFNERIKTMTQPPYFGGQIVR
jgi:hypothetical protein